MDEKAKAKIAIIEDDVTIVQMYRTKFLNEGYTVEMAGDGVVGLKLIKEFQPDIVLLDLMMPTMNGIDMLRELRKLPGGKEVRVVVLTNMGDDETAQSVKGLGVLEYIVKAEMTPSKVAERVKELLKNK